MFRPALLVAGLLVGPAAGQPPGPVKPLLTSDLYQAVRAGTGTMSEADAIKLLPAGYKVAKAPAGIADWRITCAETTEVEVEFVAGKVSAFTATFHPSVTSKRLTLERFRKLKEGQSPADVEALFGTDNRSTSRDGRNLLNQPVTKWRFVHGRELIVNVTGGVVSGSGLMGYVEK
jgi:hypothetical protein